MLVERFCRYEERHHTSSRYNMTNYYVREYVRGTFGLDDEPDFPPDIDAVAALAGYKAFSAVHENCHVEWLEWSGTRNHPRATEMSADGCQVEIKKNTALVTFADGKTMKKRLTTRGFRFIPQASTDENASLKNILRSEGYALSAS